VLLLHGYGEDSQIWNNQIEYLSTHCLLIVPDLPGSGKSSITAKGKEEWLPNLRIESLAHSMNEILIAENLAACILLGHSMGGYISLAFAELYPSKILALGLVHSTAYADSDEKKSSCHPTVHRPESPRGSIPAICAHPARRVQLAWGSRWCSAPALRCPQRVSPCRILRYRTEFRDRLRSSFSLLPILRCPRRIRNGFD